MRALTVRQPWAAAIIYSGKDVENRAQTWGYRGPLAIHAGAERSIEGENDPRVRKAWAGAEPYQGNVRGAIIGVVDLTDVHHAAEGCCDSQWADAAYKGSRAIHLVLASPVPLAEPVPAKGVLGLWQVSPRLVRAVAEQLPAPAVPL